MNKTKNTKWEIVNNIYAEFKSDANICECESAEYGWSIKPH